MSASTDNNQFGSSLVSGQTNTPPPLGVNSNQSSFGQHVQTFRQAAQAFGQQPALMFVQAAPGVSVPAFGQLALMFVQAAPTVTQSDPAFGQPALMFLQATPTANGNGMQPTGILESTSIPIPAMEKPKDSLSSLEANGSHPENGIMSQKVNESDIDELMPKLNKSDYYTIPTIQELAAKERVEPGYTGRVKNFIVGRHGFGNIRFLGETDVRRVDLDYSFKFVDGRFGCRKEKPTAEYGFYETAEITIMGGKLSHEEMIYRDNRSLIFRNFESCKKLTEDPDFEFVSYDPVNGEYKFRVKYFSGPGSGRS